MAAVTDYASIRHRCAVLGIRTLAGKDMEELPYTKRCAMRDKTAVADCWCRRPDGGYDPCPPVTP